MSSIQTPGVINMRGAKAPHPKKSAKGFKWPSRPTEEQRKAFATVLAQKMEETKHTHISLARYFWGTTVAGGTAGSLIASWLRLQKFPSPKVADYLAQYFKVSAEELLQAKGEYKDPAHLIVNSKGQMPTGRGGRAAQVAKVNGEAPASPSSAPLAAAPINGKRKYTKKMNGHAHVEDPRWLLPKGVEPPHVKLETSKKRAMWNVIEVKAEVPPEVAMSVYQLLNLYRVESVE